MYLVLIAAAAVALGAHAHQHPARPSGPAGPYTTWLLRQQGPALHR